MPDQGSKRIGVTILVLCALIASINAAHLYVLVATKADLEKRVETLELRDRAKMRKEAAVDRFLQEMGKGLK